MVPSPESVSPLFVRRLELAADQAFNMLVADIETRASQGKVFDYPVASLVLDETGIMRLGEGVSTDKLSGDPTSHAELNALERAQTSGFESAIVVSTMESCVMCQKGITHQIGHNGLIAYVMSRTLAEQLEHVNQRPTTDHASIQGVRSLQLMHPRLQKKGQTLFRNHVSRDRETGVTTIDPTSLYDTFAQIDQDYTFDDEPTISIQTTGTLKSAYPLK
jgi:tRNA(Arg) A34 adenosine deaminase TadA